MCTGYAHRGVSLALPPEIAKNLQRVYGTALRSGGRRIRSTPPAAIARCLQNTVSRVNSTVRREMRRHPDGQLKLSAVRGCRDGTEIESYKRSTPVSPRTAASLGVSWLCGTETRLHGSITHRTGVIPSLGNRTGTAHMMCDPTIAGSRAQ